MRSRSYEVVKAKDAAEAIMNSCFFVGQEAVVKEVNVTANSDGTWCVFPEFMVSEQRKGQNAASKG